MDTEKIVHSLRICFFDQGKCEDCFYYDTTDFVSDCRDKLIKQVIYNFEAESPVYKSEGCCRRRNQAGLRLESSPGI